MTVSEQLALDMVAPVGEQTDRIGAGGDIDITASMISAVIGSLPMTGHSKGTWREKRLRPMAYLYACRDRLTPVEREVAVKVCSLATGELPGDLLTVTGAMRETDAGLAARPVWLRMNGPRAGRWGYGRESFRMMDGTPETDGYSWALNIAQASDAAWRRGVKAAQAELSEVARPALGTLAGWLLVLRWSPALRLIVTWRRRSGCSMGHEMLVRRDLALSAGHVPDSEQKETYRLAQLDPHTSMLARAVMSVEPRGLTTPDPQVYNDISPG